MIENDQLTADRLFTEIRERAIQVGYYRPNVTNYDAAFERLTTIWVRGVRADMIDLLDTNSQYTHGFRFRPIRKGFSITALSTNPKKRSNDNSMSAFAMVDDTTKQCRLTFIRRSPYVSNMEEELRVSFSEIAQDGSEASKSLTANSFGELEEFISKALDSMSNKYARIFNYAIKPSVKLKRNTDPLRALTKDILMNWAKVTMEAALYQFYQSLDIAVRNFAREIAKQNQSHQPTSDLDLYNFLLEVPKTSPAFEYRMGAIQVLAPTGIFYLSDKLYWDKIDQGQSIHAALSEKFEVPAATVKQVFKRPHLVIDQTDAVKLKKLWGDLALLPPDMWPETKADIPFFRHANELAAQMAQSFGGNKADYMVEMAKERKRHDERTWEAVMLSRLDTEVSNVRSKGGKSHRKNGVSFTNDSVVGQAILKRNTAIRNVHDMKVDIQRRILLPWAMLHVEARGFRVTNTNVMTPLVQFLNDRIWEGASPSAQMEASSYWHSPHVGLTRRFQSAAVATNTNGVGWTSLFDDPMKLECGATLVPLNSDALLKEEGQIIGHCVGGYAIHCLKSGYHIFSVRDGDKRLSTLTIVDYFDDGIRKIKHSQHTGNGPGTRNAPISSFSRQAEHELLNMVNKGEFFLNWIAIDKSKEVFLGQDAELTIGYEFRDPAKLQAVFEVFEPCLPRKLLRGLGRQAPTFLDGLQDQEGRNIGTLVDALCIDPLTLAQGGIFRHQPEPQVLQMRPRIGG